MDQQSIETMNQFSRMPAEKVSPLLIRTAQETLSDAANMPEIQPLIPGVWNVGEFAILAGDTGSGKSLFAMQECIRIAQQRKVLYLDFELTDKQFEHRYLNASIPDTLLRASYDPAALEFNFDFSHIEQAVEQYEVDTIILDNVSALALRSTAEADVAIDVCKGLKKLQTQFGVSSLIIAHIPKIPECTPLNINHLAGSKHLANFADAITFVGKSQDGANVRYIKNVKYRYAESPGVYAIEIHNPGGYLQYRYLGHCEEADHLQPNARDILKDAVIEKRSENKSLREIQKEIFFEHGEKVSHVSIKKWTDAPVNGSVNHSSEG